MKHAYVVMSTVDYRAGGCPSAVPAQARQLTGAEEGEPVRMRVYTSPLAPPGVVYVHPERPALGDIHAYMVEDRNV